MDYWIYVNGVQKGPYSLQQLRAMWEQGHASADTFYYDHVRSEWKLIGLLFESTHQLFSVEEAFVRLGQNRDRGHLCIYNNKETLHLYVEGGYVVCALGDHDHGEFALSRALHLENSTYDWFYDVKAPHENLKLNIHMYALQHSIARDIRVGNAATRKNHTVALPKTASAKTPVPVNFYYVLVAADNPNLRLKLDKSINVLGRESHCDLVVDDPQVSRKHCLLETSDQYVKVKDLDSSNGIFLNGITMPDGFLKVGDQLGLGSYKLTLQKDQKKAPSLS